VITSLPVATVNRLEELKGEIISTGRATS